MKNRLARPALVAALLIALPAPGALDVTGISRDLDPCVDFYQFANRKWLESAAIPDDQAGWGTFLSLRRRTEEDMKRILDAAIASPPAPGTAPRKGVDYYASGMDTAAIERAGLEPLAPAFARIAAVKDAATLSSTLAALRISGINAGFGLTVQPDAKESMRYIVQAGQGGIALPDRDYYFKDDERTRSQREAYREHVAKVFVLAGDAPAAAARHAEAVFALETELARASMTAVERRDVDRTYNRMSLEQLAASAPGFPWKAHFAALGLPDPGAINVAQPRFFTAFARLAAQRPAADWQAYLRWHLLRDASTKLPRAFDEADFAFFEATLTGKVAAAERHRRVLLVITGARGTEPLGHTLGQLYVEHAFPPEAKAKMTAMVANVKAALAERLRALDWMGEETRLRALEKLDAMSLKVGYPDRWADFKDAQVGGNRTFVENWMQANAYRHRRNVERVGKPVDRAEWFTSPHIVNAFYSPPGNGIVFPAAILQPPFFDPKADDAVNYGGIGMVIGHEITHGFDNRGRRYDARGNLSDWWTPEDAKRYGERANRVERQYNEYDGVEGQKVNGKLTLGENISDIGGTKIALLALQKAIAGKPAEAIDGLTPGQRFFLSFAQVWRGVNRPAQERLLLATDSHSPARYRVQGTIANLPEFAKAFSCDPAKTLRAESERVNIW